ncbi:Aste57867_11464 [Aphanomyces stellatus]|uniref:Aste57867_11464 protein n=1 Tax=Aphanomyces stellatus TaxID=120398 RepID=A0A485KTK9_9STRA|nr:hypothetical protein As57867_011421 [Aphanomyces stellatus]VFT88325.1 Aste57867_11464 [Aphanomyces stellatus]
MIQMTKSVIAVSSNEASAVRQPKRKRITLKQEIAYLKTKQLELQAQLEALKPKMATAIQTMWEVRAKDQLVESQKAQRKTQRSERCCETGSSKTAQALERVLKKKSRLEMTPNFSVDEWRQWRLDTNRARRHDAIKAITDHMLGKLDSEFIQNGIFDLKVEQSGRRSRPGNASIMKSRGEVLLEVDDDGMGKMAYLRTHSTRIRRRTLKTAVCSFARKADGSFAWPFKPTELCTVLVYRSILDDAHVPHDANQWHDNLLGWITLERCPTDATKTLQRYFYQSTIAITPMRATQWFMVQVDPGQATDFLLLMLRIGWTKSSKPWPRRLVASTYEVAEIHRRRLK